MPIDDDTLELLERRMSERVEANVRSRLFKIYGTVGGGVIAALAYFGYDIIDSTRDRARTYAEEAVAPTVQTAREAAEDAKGEAVAAAAMLEVVNDWMADRSQRLSEIEEGVQATIAKIQRMTSEQEARLEAVSGMIKTNEEALEDQKRRSLELYAGQGDLQQLADQLVNLSSEVKALDTRMSSLPRNDGEVVPAVGAGPPSTAQTAIQEIIDKSGGIVPPTAGNQTATVYFQFAGVERDVAKALRAGMAAENFNMPGEERTGIAAGLHEVRYFFPEDQAAAEKFTDAVNRWLEANRFEAAVNVRDYTGYSRAKPKPGTIELWLEPKPVST